MLKTKNKYKYHIKFDHYASIKNEEALTHATSTQIGTKKWQKLMLMISDAFHHTATGHLKYADIDNLMRNKRNIWSLIRKEKRS
jgi:hypothetical protein